MVSKNYLMEEGTLSKKDILSKNFINNLKKKVPYQKSKKNDALLKNLIRSIKKYFIKKKKLYQKPYQESKKGALSKNLNTRI